jgi:hypothetical protein
MIEHVPNMCKALGLIPRFEKKKKKIRINKTLLSNNRKS